MMGENPTLRNVSLKVARNAAKAATVRMAAGFRVCAGTSLALGCITSSLSAAQEMAPRQEESARWCNPGSRLFLLYRDQIYAPSSATCVVCSSYSIARKHSTRCDRVRHVVSVNGNAVQMESLCPLRLHQQHALRPGKQFLCELISLKGLRVIIGIEEHTLVLARNSSHGSTARWILASLRVWPP